jgi:hypothetical protein
MNHQPFEEWLLEDQQLDQQQSKLLQEHLGSCSYCSALVNVDQVLKNPVLESPSQGFTERFRIKLEKEKKLQRQRLLWGIGLFGFLALLLVGYIGYEVFTNWVVSPTSAFINLVTWLAGFSAALETFGSVGLVLINISLGIIPLPLWLVFFTGGFLLVLLWVATLRKLSYSVQARRLT